MQRHFARQRCGQRIRGAEALVASHLLVLKIVTIELLKLLLETDGESVVSHQFVITNALQETRFATCWAQNAAGAAGGDPEDELIGGINFDGRIDNRDRVVVFIFFRSHTDVAQHGVGGSAGKRRGLPIPYCNEHAAAPDQCRGQICIQRISSRRSRGDRNARRRAREFNTPDLRMPQ